MGIDISEPSTSSEIPPFVREEVRAIDMVKMIRILHSRLQFILKMTGIVAFISIVLAFAIKPRYTAYASFIPPSSPSTSSASILAGQLSSTLGLGASLGGLKSPGYLYVGILQSHTVSSAIVKRFNLMQVYKEKRESDAEKRLASHSTFEVGPKDSIVSITVTDKSPQRAADITNAYLEALQTTSSGLALTESMQRRSFYENRLAKEKNDLAAAEVALKETQEKTGFIAPAGQTAAEIQTLAQLRAQLTAREVSLAALLESQTPQSPDVINLQAEISNLRSKIEKSTRGASGPTGGFSNAQTPSLELDYIRAAREVKYHEALFGILSRQYEAARLDEENSTPLQILDHATIPDKKSGPPKLLIILGGLFGGCFLACFWVLFQYRVQNFLHNFRISNSTTP